MESFLKDMSGLSLQAKNANVRNVNDQRGAADIAWLDESNIDDWVMVVDSSEVREAMETELWRKGMGLGVVHPGD